MHLMGGEAKKRLKRHTQQGFLMSLSSSSSSLPVISRLARLCRDRCATVNSESEVQQAQCDISCALLF